MLKKNLQSLLETGDQQLQKLNDIVLKAIEEEKLISNKLYEFEEHNPSLKSRIADKIAAFGGSWLFITFSTLATVCHDFNSSSPWL